MAKQDLQITRLDLRKMIRASLWFLVVMMALKLFVWDELSWWVATAPFWSSLFFSMFTTNYNEKGDER